MPPSKHSGSSRSAHKDSDQIPTDQNYTLGDYSFRIERSSVPGSTNDKIEAICTDKDGKNARKSIQVPSSTQLLGWYVEANETEASVYATVKYTPERRTTGELLSVVLGGKTYTGKNNEFDYFIEIDYPPMKSTRTGPTTCVFATSEPIPSGVNIGRYGVEIEGDWKTRFAIGNISTYTYDDKTVYYCGFRVSQWTGSFFNLNTIPISNVDPTTASLVAWDLVYGVDDKKTEKDILVGRFAIDLEDAGGDGPGSDWTDPGDYDPDWEEGDPTHTLYVTVTGALSGRHNDPIVEPSYSYIPADKNTVKDYGCGGDGGHGGGGGAGAATVVVHKFATNQAGNKEITAIARRHGYGSGGGKGGKGGDGCILVYY